MLQWKRAVTRMAVVPVSLVLGLSVACGGGSDSGGSTNAKPATSGADRVSEGGTITVIAKDNSFDPQEFSARAGQKVTLTLTNKGAALHNFVVKDQKGADGQELQTPLLQGSKNGTLEFTFPAGSYEFYCSVHPIEMRGKLRVE